MCCFSGPVREVNHTLIFARAADSIRQFIVYSMTLYAPTEVAMVLPLPIKSGTGEDGVTFINLEGYPEFFSDLRRGFPFVVPAAGGSASRSIKPERKMLEVVPVGSYDASFVPTVNDFSRLDPRFQLPRKTWDQVPRLKKSGFAVFKLKAGRSQFHPMAFSFPRADVNSLFFPTVHIHDGTVHDKARFDHNLYCQRNAGKGNLTDWEESAQLARDFVWTDKAKELIDGEQHCYRKELTGTLPNKDTFISQ
jgi:hypothetical protein